MAKICGNCKSSDIKNVKAVYQQLVTNIQSGTIGIGMISGGIGGGVSRTSGTSAPELIKSIDKIKPNEDLRVRWFIGSLFAAGITGFATYLGIKEKGFLSIFSGWYEDGTGFMLFIPCLLLCIISLRKVIAIKKDKKKYESTWYCFSCGQFRIFKS